MLMIRAAWLALLVISASLTVCGPAHADGFIIGKKGYVFEREQSAFIEWKDGQERLWVATRSDLTSDPTVWIVPVPSKPELVKGEPVEQFPRVSGGNQLLKLRNHLTQTRNDVFVNNIGPVPLFMLVSFLGQRTSGIFSNVALSPGGVQVHSHVEKHGMVVQVLTARTPEALDAYLRGRKLDVKTDQLHSLRNYLGKENSLVCAWRSEAGSTARALRIDFPCANIFYPMLPTRVNKVDLRTSIFVRGWVRPLPGTNQPGMRFEQGLWGVRGTAFDYSPNSSHSLVNIYRDEDAHPEGPLEPLTRVIVPSDPSRWEADIVLEPPVPVSMDTTIFLAQHHRWLSLAFNASLGLLFGLVLPWLLLPVSQRRWHDWLVLPLLGASLCFSVFFPTLGLLLWCNLRFPDSTWTNQQSILQVVLVFIFILPIISAGICAWRTFHFRGYWLLVFLVLHATVVVVTCQALLAWLP
jgi:hypothetical protein